LKGIRVWVWVIRGSPSEENLTQGRREPINVTEEHLLPFDSTEQHL